MTKTNRASPLLKQHAALWYGFPGYRFAWMVLPQAIVATVLALFVMGGGWATFSAGGGLTGPVSEPTVWGQPIDRLDMMDELAKLRDGVANNSAPEGLAALEEMAAAGNLIASGMMGSLYDPTWAGTLPYPVDKDAKRAIGLYQVAADAGDIEAKGALARLFLTVDTPDYDTERGCKAAHDYMDRPLDALKAMGEDDVWHLFAAADCAAGLTRAEGTSIVLADADAVKQAVEIYNLPVMKEYYAHLEGLAQIYLLPESPVYDVTLGCEKAREWVAAIGDDFTGVRDADGWVLRETAFCLLGTDGRRPEGEPYGPKPDNEKLAKKLIELPMHLKDENGIGLSAWYNLNENHAFGDPVTGCARVNEWSELTKEKPEERANLTRWMANEFASCLLSTNAKVAAFTPSPLQMKTGLALYEDGVTANDPYAQRQLGLIYYWGSAGIEKDRARAFPYFQKCAEQSDAECIEALGDFRQWGTGGFAVDYEGAIAQFKKCADMGLGICDAKVVQTRFSQDTPGREKDADTLAHLQAAVGADVPFGYSLYAVAVYEGNLGLRQDAELAAQWFIKAFALPGGNTEVNRFEQFSAPYIDSSKFWKALHQELTARGVYNGPISSKMNKDTIAAAQKLAG